MCFWVCVCVCVRVCCVGGLRCGVVWCVGGGVAGAWCGWSLATTGGGSCVLLPATPGWVSLLVVVGVPRHSWLRVSGAAPRHSWLGSAGRGGGCVRGWGFPVLCVPVARRVLVCALCVRGVGVGVGVSSVCVGACVAACGGLFPWLGLAAGVSVGGGVVGVWALPRHSWRRFLCAFPRHVWLGCAAGGGGCSSPLLAEGPGCGPLPLLAGVRQRWWCVVACPFWVWSWLRFPATPGWGPPAAAVAVCVGLTGVSRGVWVCGAVRARMVSVLVCVSCVCGGVGVGVSSVCVGVCVCVRGCVAGAGSGLLLVWVWVWLVCAVVGPSPLLVEVPECDFLPLLAGFRCRRWVLLATPG